jgi:dTDP-4-dehydrorhamnose 3,5-epimerase
MAGVELHPDAKRVFRLQSYTATPRIEGVEIVELTRHHDEGGSLTELLRLTEGRAAAMAGFTVRQINYSELEPGVVKAFHLHTRQTDIWYVPPADRMLVVLFDARQSARMERAPMRFMLGDGASRLVRIPPGVAHGVRNLGPSPGRIIYFVDLPFSADPAQCDEGRLPWDYLGADVWDMGRG